MPLLRKPNKEEVLPGIASYLSLNGYKMGKIIGEGSYSKVRICNSYYADGTLYRKIACKIINKKKASGDFVTKFLPRELQIVRRLQHPNIIHVYDLVEFDHHVYIFMDCCDGGDLLEYVKAQGFIDELKGRHYFRQLLSAVCYLHSQDLAHRDLKCENVLLANRDHVRISDFGFARYCRDSEGRRSLSNTYCGSAAYAAPEILLGTNYNPKLYDMWSLGCVLFIMLTGHMPFDESNLSKMLDNQMNRVLIYPAQMEGKISHTAKSLIRHLLEPDVTRRANIEQAKGHMWCRENGPSSAHDMLNNGERSGSGYGDMSLGAALANNNDHSAEQVTNESIPGDGFVPKYSRIPILSSKLGAKDSTKSSDNPPSKKPSMFNMGNQNNSKDNDTKTEKETGSSQHDVPSYQRKDKDSRPKPIQLTSGRQQQTRISTSKAHNTQFTFSTAKKHQWR